MTELECVRDSGPPREEGIVRWLAGDFEPLRGFFVYGILWFFVALAIAGVVPEQVFRGLGLSKKTLTDGQVFGILGLTFLLAWVPFGFWVRWRRAGARRLFRDGVLLEATMSAVSFGSRRGVDSTKVTISFVGGSDPRHATVHLFDHHRQLEAGATIPVLFVPEYRYCAVFPTDGAPTAGVCRRG